jgi:ceramide glucosyltransferase
MSLLEIVATICLVWSSFVIVVECVGIRSIFRHFTRKPSPSVSPKLGRDAPRVTIIRPVKGAEPRLYECIASTFRQDYPADRLSIRLCVDSTDDSAYPILCKLVEDFPGIDAKVLIEADDPYLHGPAGNENNLGPNPKIRNISRAYREAGPDDVVWIIDCNVWVARDVLGRMVDKLTGHIPGGGSAKPYKFVHQLPLVVDTMELSPRSSSKGDPLSSSTRLLDPEYPQPAPAAAGSHGMLSGGGRLDEMFMGTTHAKFYGAINEVGVAPCIVGKSNMFRKAHLDQATAQAQPPSTSAHLPHPTGVDFFSWQICEDHLIGELMWRHEIPGYSNHGLVWGDLVLQPMAGMSVASYAARRVRWLRARKFSVLAATLVEPGVESLVCCAYLAFALTTLPWFHDVLGMPQTWTAMGVVWATCVSCWMLADRVTFGRLHAGYTTTTDEHTPDFAMGMGQPGGVRTRSFSEWLAAWIGREVMALPIWVWAVMLGRTVKWRGKEFRVRFDTTVVALSGDRRTRAAPGTDRTRTPSKDRQD